MKKTFLTMALALAAAIASAKNDSIEVYRFTYEFCDSNVYAKRNYPDLLRLDIRPDGSSEFYSQYGQSKANSNKIDATGWSQADLMAHVEKMRSAKAGVAYRVLKDFPQKGQLTFTDRIATSELYYTEPILQQAWTTADGEKEICGYRCRKAETDFGGRHWTAWYAEDLPIPNGPWKLGGLPGLILEASDADNFFHFTCAGIERANALPTTRLDKKFVKTSRKEFDRMERAYHKDKLAFLLGQLQSEGASVTVMDEHGNEIKSKPKEHHIFIERKSDEEP